MKLTKEITLIGVFTALLIGGQLVLSAISGIEVVTVLMLSFSFYFGEKRGVIVATAFSLLRCVIFGFFPSVLILYLIYYNLFALVFGVIGKKADKYKIKVKTHLLLIILAVLFTVLFTCLDNVITPLFYGLSSKAAKAYFYSSIYVVIPQSVCAAVTTALMLYPLLRVYRAIKI